MANIPGILGYTEPGAYSIGRTRAGTLSLGGGGTLLCIIGHGQTEVETPDGVGGQLYGTGNPITDAALLPGLSSSDTTTTENALQLLKYPIVGGTFTAWLASGPPNNQTIDQLQVGTDDWAYAGGTDEAYLLDRDIDGNYVTKGSVDAVETMLVLLKPRSVSQKLVITYVAEADVMNPRIYTEANEIIEDYGGDSLSNTITLGSRLAFENGVSRVMICQAPPLTDEGWSVSTDFKNQFGYGVSDDIIDPVLTKCLAELEKEELDLLVALPYLPDDASPALGTGATAYYFNIDAALKTHCTQMSTTAERKERRAVVGCPSLDDVNTMLGTSHTKIENFLLDTATYSGEGYVDQQYGSTWRMNFVGLDYVTRLVGSTEQVLSGRHVAAAYAGFGAAMGYLPEPLTRKSLSGFSIPANKKFTRTTMNSLASSGIVIIEQGSNLIRHSLTTVNSGAAEEEEWSVVAVRDYVAKQSRIVMENRFTGKPFTSTIISDMNDTLKAYLSALSSQALIAASGGASVKVNPTEPRQADVQFDFKPIYPLNWIRIDFSVGLI